jgi:hypothetical protein
MNYTFHPEAEQELIMAAEPGYWQSRVHDR